MLLGRRRFCVPFTAFAAVWVFTPIFNGLPALLHYISVGIGRMGLEGDMLNTAGYQRATVEQVTFRENVIGFDSRVLVSDTAVWPSSTVTQIDAAFQTGGTFTGSGAIISDTLLVTAAHVVFDENLGGLADITATPGRSGAFMPFGQSGAADIWVRPEFMETGDHQYDFAIIELEQPLGALTGHLPFISTDGINLAGTDVRVTGFPEDRSFNNDRMFTSADIATSTDGNLLNYYTDTFGGMSGGPATVYDFFGDPILVGVHTLGGGGFAPNAGVRITDEIESLLDTAIQGGLDALRQTNEPDDLPSLVEVFRFFNTNAGGHFFTANDQEARFVRDNLASFNDEGVGFFAFDQEAAGTVPVFRFFNENAGGHFFTPNEQEADFVRDNLDAFQDEGIGFHAFDGPVENAVPVFRFFNENAGGHFFTPNEQEAGFVRDNLDAFRDEGIGFYAFESDLALLF